MGVVSLGATEVAFVDRPEQCPSGTWAKPVVWSDERGVGYHYACMVGEPWYCEWFGIGCKGPISTAPPAPRTEEQMRTPGEWTPEQVSEEWKRQQQENLQRWLESTSGVSSVANTSFVETAALSATAIAFIAGGLALLILLKR